MSWNTAEEGRSHRIYFDTRPHEGRTSSYARTVECQRNGRYTAGGDGSSVELYYHHARLQELKPASSYYFVVESDGKVSPELHFRTAPRDERPFAILFGGDSRSDPQARRQVNRMIADLAGKDPKMIAFAHGGDYIARGDNLGQWSEWMSDHELTVADSGRILPIIPARGNHDRGPLFNEVFDFPEEDENYYAIDLGPECRFITLNTNVSMAGDQKSWLEDELPRARKSRWLCAQYHAPAWPAVKGPSGAKQHWVPLFEEYDVDLVCEADGHTIKRTPPIRNGRIDRSGVTYVGEGGLGVKQRTPKIDERWWLQSPGKAGKGHHVTVLDFHRDRLDYRVVLLDGQRVFDRHTLRPRD